MDDLYDEFGNYIGEQEESEDEAAQDGAPGADAYLDEDDAEDVAEAEDQALMQVDGE